MAHGLDVPGVVGAFGAPCGAFVCAGRQPEGRVLTSTRRVPAGAGGTMAEVAKATALAADAARALGIRAPRYPASALAPVAARIDLAWLVHTGRGRRRG